MAEHEQLLRHAYEAFNARDIEGALSLMHPDVDWPNGMEGGRVHGHEAVREYWTRQFEVVDSRVEPTAFTNSDFGKVAVDVHQVVHDTSGTLLSDGSVRHVYELRDGLVGHMDIVEP